MVQLAGRAGRGSVPGRVLVQTWRPDHYVLQHLHDLRDRGSDARSELSRLWGELEDLVERMRLLVQEKAALKVYVNVQSE